VGEVSTRSSLYGWCGKWERLSVTRGQGLGFEIWSINPTRVWDLGGGVGVER